MIEERPFHCWCLIQSTNPAPTSSGELVRLSSISSIEVTSLVSGFINLKLSPCRPLRTNRPLEPNLRPSAVGHRIIASCEVSPRRAQPVFFVNLLWRIEFQIFKLIAGWVVESDDRVIS